MDGICDLLKPLLETQHPDGTLENLLLSCVDQRAFSKSVSGISSFIGSINGRLNEPSSRNEGLALLQAFLPQCSQDVLAQHGSSWIQFCLKGISLAKTAQLSFIVLKMLFELSVTTQELSRYVSSVAVASFAEQIHLGILPQVYLHALECLEQCLKRFNGPCGPHRKVIERFLLSMIDYSGVQHLQVVWQTARCIALLPQIGGGGVGGAQYKLGWAAQQKSILRTMHIILDDLYADTNELQVSLMGGMLEGNEPLQLAPIEDTDPVTHTQKLVIRLIAVSACLQAMLVMGFPVAKNVCVSSILNLICRGLAVNGSSIGGNTTTHSLALAADLPNVHHSLLKLLETLILLTRTNLLPFAGLICRLVIQTLKWTKVDDWSYSTERPFSALRIQAYKVMRLWCGTTKAGSLVEDVSQQYLDLAMQDIYTEKDSVLLSAGLLKKNRGQAKRKSAASPGAITVGNLSPSFLALNKTANKNVCIAALQAMTAVVMATSSKLQPGLHKVLQETVVAVLLKISNNAGEPPVPFSDAKARLELYRLLLQLVLDSHPIWPAPTNIALRLFSSGLHDADAEISMFCGIAQSSLEKIIHPAYPSLNLLPSEKDLEAVIGDKLVNPDAAIITMQAKSPQHQSENNLEDEVFIESPKNGRQTRSSESNVMHSTPAAPVDGYSLRSGLKTFVPPSKLDKSDSGHLDKSIGKSPVKDVNAPSTTNSPCDVKINIKTPVKSSPVSEKMQADTNSKVSNSDARRTIDLTTSDLSDDEDDGISEVPCEIDLAESEDENQSVHSNETTVDIPVTVSESMRASTLENSQSDPKSSVIDATSVVDQTDNTETSSVPASKESPVKPAKPAEEAPVVTRAAEETPAGKRAAEEVELEDSASKKAKINDDALEFASDEDSMLLSFVDVTRDEEEEEEEN